MQAPVAPVHLDPVVGVMPGSDIDLLLAWRPGTSCGMEILRLVMPARSRHTSGMRHALRRHVERPLFYTDRGVNRT